MLRRFLLPSSLRPSRLLHPLPSSFAFGVIQDAMESKLQAQFSPSLLEVINESSGHSSSNAAPESHFRIVIVAQKFAQLNRVQRHQAVYDCLADQVAKTHAVGITARSPEEQLRMEERQSPRCVGSRANEK